MTLLVALSAGLIAGLALVVPLGAIGVLLIQEGASKGWARGVPAAAAVATVDLLYCIAALTAGAVLAPVMISVDPWPRRLGGAVLLALAIWNLLRASQTSPDAKTEARARRVRPGRRFALFFGLTAINPATLVYFAAIVTGLSDVAASATTVVMFVSGVALASFSWQMLLVLVGAIVHRGTGARFRRLTTVIGHGIVGVLGILMLTGVIS